MPPKSVKNKLKTSRKTTNKKNNASSSLSKSSKLSNSNPEDNNTRREANSRSNKDKNNFRKKRKEGDFLIDQDLSSFLIPDNFTLDGFNVSNNNDKEDSNKDNKDENNNETSNGKKKRKLKILDLFFNSENSESQDASNLLLHNKLISRDEENLISRNLRENLVCRSRDNLLFRNRDKSEQRHRRPVCTPDSVGVNNGAGVGENESDSPTGDSFDLVELRRLSPGVYEKVRTFLGNLCRATESVFSGSLGVSAAFEILAKDVDNIYTCFANSSSLNGNGEDASKGGVAKGEEEKLENRLLNLLYEKFVLLIIYSCKYLANSHNIGVASYSLTNNGTFSLNNREKDKEETKSAEGGLGAVEGVSKLIYDLISHIYRKFVLSHLKKDEYNQNKLLLYVWDILLLLVHCREKRARIFFLKFLQTFVENSCLDEIVVNSLLYRKHILNVLNLLNHSSHFTLNLNNSNNNIDNNNNNINSNNDNVKVMLYRLLQSFQIKEVLDVFFEKLSDHSASEEVKAQIVEILDIFDSELLGKLVLQLGENSPKVRDAIYRKLFPHFSHLDVFQVLYVFLVFLSSTDGNFFGNFYGDYGENLENNRCRSHFGDCYGENSESSTHFFPLLENWVGGNLGAFLRLVLSSTLQLNLVLAVFSLYFKSNNFNTHTLTHNNNNNNNDNNNYLGNLEENNNNVNNNNNNNFEENNYRANEDKDNDEEKKLEEKFLLLLRLRLSDCVDLTVEAAIGELEEIVSNFPNNSFTPNSCKQNSCCEEKGCWEQKSVWEEENYCRENCEEKLAINRLNLALLTILEFLRKGPLPHDQRASVELSLLKALQWGPAKIVVPTLALEYVRLGQLFPNHSLNRHHLVTDNPLFNILLIFHHFNNFHNFSNFGNFNNYCGGDNLEDGNFTSNCSGNNRDKSSGRNEEIYPDIGSGGKSWILGILGRVCDPYEVNEVKCVRVDVGSLKFRSCEEISALEFCSFSLGQLRRFEAQVGANLTRSLQNRQVLLQLSQNNFPNHLCNNNFCTDNNCNYSHDKNNYCNNKDNNFGKNKFKNDKDRKKRLEYELRENSQLLGKQRLLRGIIRSEIQSRSLTVLTLIYLYFNFSNFNNNFNNCYDGNFGNNNNNNYNNKDDNFNYNNNKDNNYNGNNYYKKNKEEDELVFRGFVLPILRSLSDSSQELGGDSGSGPRSELEWFSNVVLLKVLAAFNFRRFRRSNVIRELRVYSSLLAQLEDGLENCSNSVFVYKFESVLKVTVDLLTLLISHHCHYNYVNNYDGNFNNNDNCNGNNSNVSDGPNNASNGYEGPDNPNEVDNDNDNEDNNYKDNNYNYREEEEVLGHVLRVLRGEVRVCAYLFAVLLRLLPKLLHVLISHHNYSYSHKDNYPHQKSRANDTENNPSQKSRAKETEDYHNIVRGENKREEKWRKLLQSYLEALFELQLWHEAKFLSGWERSLLRETAFFCFRFLEPNFLLGVFHGVACCAFSHALNGGGQISSFLGNLKNFLLTVFYNFNSGYSPVYKEENRNEREKEKQQVAENIVKIGTSILCIAARAARNVEIGEVLQLLQHVLLRGKVGAESPQRERLEVVLRFFSSKARRGRRGGLVKKLLLILQNNSEEDAVENVINVENESVKVKNVSKQEKNSKDAENWEKKLRKILDVDPGKQPVCRFFRAEKIARKRAARRRRSPTESLYDSTESETISSDYSD